MKPFITEYESAFYRFVQKVVEGFTELDPILRQIETVPTIHSGPTRNVQGIVALDQPMKSIECELNISNDSIRESDFDAAVEALAGTAECYVDRLNVMFLDTLREVTDAEGSSHNVGGAPISWDAIIDRYESMDVLFDSEGHFQPNRIMGSPETLALLQENLPTESQIARLNEVLLLKKQESDAKKRYRRIHR